MSCASSPWPAMAAPACCTRCAAVEERRAERRRSEGSTGAHDLDVDRHRTPVRQLACGCP
jgi:hypothetical protein